MIEYIIHGTKNTFLIISKSTKLLFFNYIFILITQNQYAKSMIDNNLCKKKN